MHELEHYFDKACRGDEVVVDTGNVNIAERVKAVTGGEMAYGATDAVTGDMTGNYYLIYMRMSLQKGVWVPQAELFEYP